MDELEKLAALVRRQDAQNDPEAAHLTEDALMSRALRLIAEGAADPAAVARIGLSTRCDASIRWYA